ncbi:DUF2065 domain-containing protein [Amylibacter sp.]|nr:DUF2065 domain-containing protein [Amylibacter sp.]
MNDFLTAIGIVAVIEGLVLVLAPSRFEDIIRILGSMSIQTRRNLGLIFVLIGFVIIWTMKSL